MIFWSSLWSTAVTNAFIAAQPGVIKIVGEPLNSESYGFAVRSGNTELIKKINNGLKNVKASGKYDELLANLPKYMEKWIFQLES